MKAVANNLQYRLSFIPPDSYVIQYHTTGGTWIDDGEMKKLPSGVQFNTTFGNNISFLPNSTSTGGSIVLTNPKGSTKTIQILASTGRIKIE